jgi:hypothetical protein
VLFTAIVSAASLDLSERRVGPRRRLEHVVLPAFEGEDAA